MGGEGGADQGVGPQVVVQLQSLGEVFIHALRVAGREVESDQAHAGPNAARSRRSGHHLWKHIHVIETGGSSPQHFRHRQLGAIVDEIGTDPARFNRPDMILQPGHQRQIVGQSAQQGHAGVRMRVDQAGDQNVLIEIEAEPGVVTSGGFLAR